MLRFDYDCDSDWLQCGLYRIEDLMCEPFLNLKPASKHIYDSGDFR